MQALPQRRWLLPAVVMLLAVSMPVASRAATTLSMPAAADTYLMAASPTSNYGTSTLLKANKGKSVSLIAFDLRPWYGKSIQRLELRLAVIDGNASTLVVERTGLNWYENRVGYRKITSGNLETLAELKPTPRIASNPGRLNLTRLFPSGVIDAKAMSILVSNTSTNVVKFGSRENAKPTRLILTVGDGGTVTPSATNSLKATADAFVKKKRPSTNFGGKTFLKDRGTPAIETFIAFDVSAWRGRPYESLQLKLQVNKGGKGLRVYRVSGTFKEKKVTWKSRPTGGTLLKSITTKFPTGQLTIDVGKAFSGGKVNADTLVLRITTGYSPSAIVFSSREGGTAPRLLMSGTAPQSSPTPSPSPSPSPTPTPTPTPTPSPTPSPTTTKAYIAGNGTDHGVGMSQYGARGRANAGKSYDKILAFYYEGTSLGNVNPNKGSLCPADLRPCIRVLLADAFSPSASKPARITARSGAWQSASFPGKVFPANSYLQLELKKGSWLAAAYDSAGASLADPIAVDGAVLMEPAEPDTLMEMWFRYTQANRYYLYRGQMQVRATSSGVQVVNVVGLEDYLRGVVPAEVPATWPLEAVKAQAVAARGYAYASISSSGKYDVRPTAADQMYGGVMAEYPLPCDSTGCRATLNINAASNRAVAETAGKIVLKANGNPARTYFFATGGGATENIEYAWPAKDGTPSSPVAYLKGRIDTDKNGVAFDIRASNPDKTLSASYYAWQSSKFTIAQLNKIIASKAAMAPAGKVSSFSKVTFDYGVSRVYRVTIKGDKKTVKVSGIVFKNAYNNAVNAGVVGGGKLYSTNYRLKIVP